MYLLDCCDVAGVWKVNMRLAAFEIGENYTEQECIDFLGDRIKVLKDGYWLIVKFVDYQYGGVNSDKVGESVAKIFKNFNIPFVANPPKNKKEAPNKPLDSPLEGAKDKDIDKDNDKWIENKDVVVIKDKAKNLNEPLNEIELAGTAEFVFRMTKKEIAPHDIESYWEAFLLASQGEFYPGRNKQITHFRNWLKKEVTNGTFRSVGTDQPQSRTEQYQRAYHDALAFINGGKELPGQSTRA